MGTKLATRALFGLALLLSAAPKVPGQAQDEQAKKRRLVEQYVAQLRSTDAGIRADAASSIGRLGEDARPAARALCNALLDRSTKVRTAAMNALESVYPDLHPHVITLLTDKDDKNHFKALKKIAEMGVKGGPATPVILNHLKTNVAATNKVPLGNRPQERSDPPACQDSQCRADRELVARNQQPDGRWAAEPGGHGNSLLVVDVGGVGGTGLQQRRSDN